MRNVIMMHSVGSVHTKWKEAWLSIETKQFEHFCKYLYKHKYRTHYLDHWYENEGNGLSRKDLYLTFDDGYLDNLLVAYPIMKKYGMKGTIFVVTGFLGVYDNYLTWDQAKELLEAGFNIESHTYSHKSMTEASDEDITKELVKSRQTIKEKLGIDSDFMAYPTGTYTLHIAELVKEAGYKGAFTIKYDNVSRDSNVYALERVPVFHTSETNKDFWERLQYIPLLYKYGWIKN